jgi:hypothetical protein
MQKYPLIALGDLQQFAHLLAIESLDVSQSYDLALACWKFVER